MTIVDSLIKISEWLNENVCAGQKFKVPPVQGKPLDDRYQYEEIEPHAFPVFLPAKDKVPPGIKSNFPSVTVQILAGTDDTVKCGRDMTINLGFSCWNPGIHSLDWYYPEHMQPEKPEEYKSGYDGWMDAWNFIDRAIQKIESVTNINGLKISNNIKFGSYKEQESLQDLYPYWFAWIQFDVSCDFIRNIDEFKDLL